MKVNLTEEEQTRIKNIKTQNLAIFSLIVASSISIYINYGNIDMIIYKEDSSFTQKSILNLAKISSIIVWIVSIYFVILNINTYQSEKTKANASFLSASLLALSASSIRLFTLFSNDNLDVTSEDIE